MGILDRFKLDGKVAVVTGASSGLGVAFAKALAEAGADVAIGARVFHEKFGYGFVMDQEGNKLELEFEKAGTKRVLDSFVKLADD